MDTFGKTLAKTLIEFLEMYNLIKNKFAYVKNERFNLNIMTFALRLIVNCDLLGLEENHRDTCLGRAFSKAY